MSWFAPTYYPTFRDRQITANRSSLRELASDISMLIPVYAGLQLGINLFAGWVNALLARRPARVVTVAVANKLARIAWAVMRRGGTFRQAASAIA